MISRIECVPNFSEGRDASILAAIASAIQSIDHVQLLHQDTGASANRTVFTFAGEADQVFEAAYQAIKVAVEKIDMRLHKGTHPRIGACDVCPFIPLEGISLDELNEKVLEFGKRIHADFHIPIFLYEHSSTNLKRKRLASHRIGNYESLEARINEGIHLPDIGASFNPKFGGMVLGARAFLVAYNINLNTKDAKIAHEIAVRVRTLGRAIKENGKTRYQPGLLKHVRAIGWYIPEFGCAQVSINLVDFETTGLFEVFETVSRCAKELGVLVTGSELIGLIPLKALLQAGQAFNTNAEATEKQLLESAIKGLGLNDLANFSPEERVLEYCLEKKVDGQG